MCVVSMIHDWGNKLPDAYWTYPNADYFKELVRKAAEYDRITNQPHCEDPEKVKLLERIEKLLEKLEEKTNSG